MSCQHSFFFDNESNTYKCQVAREDCTEDYDLINFFSFTFCSLGGYWGLYLVFCFILILIIFRFITITIEGIIFVIDYIQIDYLAPSIQYICQYYSIPDSICAITLLALVNGAGDLVAAFVASGQEGGLQYNIGAIYGAGLFVTTIVIGLISMSGVEIKVSNIIRDVGTYIGSTLLLILFGIIGQITVWTSILMLSIYAGLVLYIVIQEYRKKKLGIQTEDLFLKQALVNIQLVQFDEFNGMELSSNYNKIYDDSNASTNDFPFKVDSMEIEQESKNPFRHIVKIVDIVLQSFLYITLPHSPQQHYHPIRLIIFLLPASIMTFYLHTNGFNILTYSEYVLPFILATMILIFFATRGYNPQPKGYIFFQFLTIYIALAWTYLATDILVDSLQTLGMISNLQKSYLGLTIISVGNALPDAITTITLAKQGQQFYKLIINYYRAVLGIIGSYTGQLFGLLVGFGLSLLRITLNQGPIQFNLFSYLIESLVIFTTLFILIGTLIYTIISKGMFDKRLGYGLVIGYLVFFTVVSSIAFTDAYI